MINLSEKENVMKRWLSETVIFLVVVGLLAVAMISRLQSKANAATPPKTTVHQAPAAAPKIPRLEQECVIVYDDAKINQVLSQRSAGHWELTSAAVNPGMQSMYLLFFKRCR